MSNCDSEIVPLEDSSTSLIQYSSFVRIFFGAGTGGGLLKLLPPMPLAPELAPPLTLPPPLLGMESPLGVGPRLTLSFSSPPAFSKGLLIGAPLLTGISIGSPKYVTPPVLFGKPALKVKVRFSAICPEILNLQITLPAYVGPNLGGKSMNGVSIKETFLWLYQYRPV